MKTRARSDSIEMGERARPRLGEASGAAWVGRSRRRPCLFSEVAARANGPRTVPVRSASEVRSGQEKSAICAPDNPLRTGTVRAPIQRDVPTGLNRYRLPRRRLLRTRARIISTERFAKGTTRGRAERQPGRLRSPLLSPESFCLRPAFIALACAATLLLTCGLQAQSYSFTTFIGFGGESDGVASTARFSAGGIAVDRAGNIYVGAFSTIRKITQVGTNWVVSTLAGQAGTAGSANGTGSQARFTDPNGLGVDSAGNIYATDQTDLVTTTYRKITPSGVVSTLTRYSHPTGAIGVGVAVDGEDNIYMSQYASPVALRKITPAGVITIWATLDFEPAGMGFDPAGNLYLADLSRSIIRKITPDGLESILAGQTGVAGSTDGTGADALFGGNSPRGLATDSAGNMYVGDTGNFTIRKVTLDGVVSTLVGRAGVSGTADGTGSDARFSDLGGLATDVLGNIYVADGDAVRKVTPAGVVSTIAGQRYDAQPAFQIYPRGAATDGAGNLFVSDSYSNLLYRITPEGGISILARQSVGALTIDGASNVYATGNDTILKITPDGMVSTLAGTTGVSGSADGTNGAASFNGPGSVAMDGPGNLYEADTGNYTIRRITTDGAVTTLAGRAGVSGSANGTGSEARFYSPSGVAVDSAGDVYVADTYTHTIRKVTQGGVVTTLAGLAGSYGSTDGTGSAARFNYPSGVAVDSAENIYVVDSGNLALRKITPAGVVTTVAGHAPRFDYGAHVDGPVDGPGDLARFQFNLRSLAFDASGNIYVTDSPSIRKGIPTSALPPVRLRPLSLNSSQFGFWVSGLPRSTVAVESSSDLSHWQLVGICGLEGGTNLFISPTPVQGNQFYRARP